MVIQELFDPLIGNNLLRALILLIKKYKKIKNLGLKFNLLYLYVKPLSPKIGLYFMLSPISISAKITKRDAILNYRLVVLKTKRPLVYSVIVNYCGILGDES